MVWALLPKLALLATYVAPRVYAVVFESNTHKLSQANAPVGDSGVAHVVVTADKEFRKDPAMRSVLRHASGPVKLYTFLAENDANASALNEIDGHPVEIIRFTRKEIKPYFNLAYKAQKTDYGDPKSPHSYVRYIMAEKLPNIDKVLYLDADTITTVDVNQFLNEHLNDGQVLAAFPSTSRNWYESKLDSMRTRGFDFTSQKTTFNPGVMVWNLAKWREGNWKTMVQKLIAANNKYKWWTSASQPPLNLMLGNHMFERLPTNLIVEDMGLVKGGPVTDTPGGRFYHWQGPRKAWTYAGFHKKLYGKYTIDKFAKESSDGTR